MEKSELFSFSVECDDIPELTAEQSKYICTQQEKAFSIVSDPENQLYEPDEEKRLTAARKLMREWEHTRMQKNRL